MGRQQNPARGKVISELPVFDASIFTAASVKPTTAFRRLGFLQILTTESRILSSSSEASETGSWKLQNSDGEQTNWRRRKPVVR
jgi:hypothetical protein